MKKLLLALLLALTVAFAVVSCKDDKNPAESGTDAVSQTEPASEKDSDAATEKDTTPAESETVKETEKETEKETTKETEKETTKETETEKETEPQGPADGIYSKDDPEAHFVHLSFDECEAWKGEEKLNLFFDPGASSSAPEVFEVPGEADRIRIWGWVAWDAEFDSFGYQIDGGKVVYDPEFDLDQGENLTGAAPGSTVALRMKIYADISTLSSGEHTIAAIYKLADGTQVRYLEIKINIGYRKPVLSDATNSFTSNLAEQEKGGNDKFSACDLSGFFTVELPTGAGSIKEDRYVLDGISDFYVAMDGTYSFYINMLNANLPGAAYAFVRGTKVVHSVDVPKQEGAFYPINNYYETDGTAESCGGSGIGVSVKNENGQLTMTVTVKKFNAEIKSRVDNARFQFPVSSTEVLIVDDNDTIRIFSGKTLVTTIKLEGAVQYEDVTGSDVHFVAKATLTDAEGKEQVVENTLVVDNAASDIGVAARGASVEFDKLEVKPLSATVIPGEPVFFAGPDYIKEKVDAGGLGSVQMSTYEMGDGYITLTSTDGDPYVAIIGVGANLKVDKYVLIKYRTTGQANGEIFIGSESGWHGGTDEVKFDYVNDGEWHYILVDASTAESFDGVTCNYLRYDYFGGNGGSIDVAYVAIFASEEEAKAYYEKTTEAPAPERENIAAGKDATSNSIEDDDPQKVASLAVDGDNATRWGAKPQGDAYWQVDLGNVYVVDSLKVFFENSVLGYTVQVSTDGETFTTVYTGTPCGSSTVVITLETPAKARYIRLVRDASEEDSAHWFSIYEFAAYGEKEAEPVDPPKPTIVDKNDTDKVTHVSEDNIKTSYNYNDGVATIVAGGWLGLKGEFTAVGYVVDDGTPVMNAGWLVTADPAVVAAAEGTGATHATRFNYSGTLEGLEVGTHTVRYLVQMADGTLVAYTTRELVVEAENPNVGPQEGKAYSVTLNGQFTPGGYNDPVEMLGYGNTVSCGKINLAWYSSVTIEYGCDGGPGTEAAFAKLNGDVPIGIKNKNTSYGAAGGYDMDGDLAHADMVFSSTGWAGGKRTVNVDLSNVTYDGDVWMALHNPEGTQVVISSIVFNP